jgi:hypothetical protein
MRTTMVRVSETLIIISRDNNKLLQRSINSSLSRRGHSLRNVTTLAFALLLLFSPREASEVALRNLFRLPSIKFSDEGEVFKLRATCCDF